MIVQFYQEQMSLRYARGIVDKVWRAAQVVGFGSVFPQKDGGRITDDHVPVNEVAGIPCIVAPGLPPWCWAVFAAYWAPIAKAPSLAICR